MSNTPITIHIDEPKEPRSKAKGTWGIYPKSISRIESEKYCAWFVRIYYQGAFVRKTFSDTNYNGRDDALREAIAWRDEIEAAMGKPRTDRSVRKKTVVDERDTGIYRRNAKHMKRGKIYYRDIYEVVWSPAPGKLSRRTISVTKHGEEQALEMARALRRQKEQEHFGGVVSEERRSSL